MNNNLLLIVKQNSPISTMDLAKKLDQSETKKKPDLYFAGVVNDLKELEDAGEVICIGKKFIDQYGKLFDVYTAEVSTAKEHANAYNLRNKNAQMLALAKSLYAEFKEHQTTQALEDAAELIKKGNRKINLKYHLLETPDIISVYKRVIKDAPKWFNEEKKHETQQREALKKTKFKIPY